jgi:single-strand DNA-binding protein
MANLNKVMLIGNLTRDPQLRFTPSQMAICEFGLAINRKYKAGTGEMKEEVCFVDITAWGKQAETLSKYVTKGQQLFVEGRLTYDQWETPEGQKRSKLKVTLDGFQFLSSGQRGSGGGGAAAGAAGASGGAAPAEKGPGGGEFTQDLEDDTIPF